MPDVGVLNLEIHDNSEKAAQGLEALDGVLLRIRHAVQGALGLSKVATEVRKLSKAVDESLDGSVISRINQLTEALSKLNGLGSINIKINGKASVDSIVEAVQRAQDSMSGINTGFDDVGRQAGTARGNVSAFNAGVKETEQLMNSSAWAYGAAQFRELFDAWSKFKSAMTLGPGEQVGVSTEVEKGWTAWKNGAIEVEGTVTDAMGNVVARLGEPIKYLTGISSQLGSMNEYIEHTSSLADELGKKTSAWSDGKHAIIPYDGVSGMENAFDRVRESADAATGAIDRTYNNAEKALDAATMAAAAEAAEIRRQQEEKFYAGTRQHFDIGQTNAMADQLSKLDLYKAKLREAEIEYNKFVNTLGQNDSRTIAAGLRVSDLRDKIWEFKNALKEARNEKPIDAGTVVSGLTGMNEVDLMTMKYNAMKQALIDDVAAGKLDAQAQAERAIQLNRLASKLDDIKNKATSAASAFRGLKSALSSIKQGTERLFSPMTKLIKQFANIAKRMAIRAIIRQFTQGLREGVENLYNYSKAMGTSFAPAMDAAATSLQLMKNSLAAALSPILQSLIPVLQSAVDWFVQALNYANQFFALLRGQQTWTKAIPATTTAFNKQEKAAKSAGNAIKDLLADWDELNIIQSETSGAAGGLATSNAEEALKMFEETSVFERDITNLVKTIKDDFETIQTIALAIGATILTWKVSKAFGNTLGFLSTLELAAGITLAITGAKTIAAAGYDIGENGINSDNILKAIGGIFEEALGGAAIGLAFAGVTGGILGFTIGATIGIAVLYATLNPNKDELYGNVKLTAEQIEAEVNKLFTIDVTAEVKNATVDHQSLVDAKQKLEAELHQMNADYATFKLRLTTDSAVKLAKSVQQTVDAANALLTVFQTKISLGFGFKISYDDPELVQAFSTDNLVGIEGYISDLGNGIGEILKDGIVDGVDEQKLLDELMTKLQNVTSAIEMGKSRGKFAAKLEEIDWTKVDKDSLIQYATTYNSQYEKVVEAARLNAEDTKEALGGIYAAMEQRELDNPGTYTPEQLQKAKEAYESYDVKKAIDDYVNVVTSEGTKVFVENMTAALYNAASNLVPGKNFHVEQGVQGGLNADTSILEWFQRNLADNMGWANGYDDTEGVKQFVKVLNAMGDSGFNMLPEDIKDRYIDQIISTRGETTDTFKALRDDLKVSFGDLFRFTYQDAWDDMSKAGQFNLIQMMSGIYSGQEIFSGFANAGVDLNDLLTTLTQFGKLGPNTISMIKEAYGEEAYFAALKKQDIDTGEMPEIKELVDETVQQGNIVKNGLDELLEKYNYSKIDYLNALGTAQGKYNSGVSLEALNGMLVNASYPQEIIDYMLDFISGGQFTHPDTSGKLYRVDTDTVSGMAIPVGGYGVGGGGGNGEMDISGDVERGTENANGDHWTTVENRLLQIAQALAKGIPINLTPNSTMGFFGARAAEAVDRVNG